MKSPYFALFALLVFCFASSKALAVTSDGYYKTGMAYYEQKQYSDALSFFRRAIEVDPNNWQAYQVMGYCLGRIGNYAEALDACEKSLKIHPDNPTLRDFTDQLRVKVSPTAIVTPSASNIRITATPTDGLERDWRADRKFGLYLSVIGDPFVSIGGLNLAYNATPFLRLTGGIGFLPTVNTQVSSPYSTSGSSSSLGTSIGAGVKFLVPGWEFSPVVGLNFSEVFLGTLPSFGTYDYEGTLPTSLDITFLYPNLGFDYQAKDGFNIGFGLDLILLIGLPPNVVSEVPVLGIPYLNAGMFF